MECKFYGKRVQLPLAGEWFTCDHPKKPHGEHVCKCKQNTCSPNCSGFVLANVLSDDLPLEFAGQLRRVKINPSTLVKAPADAHFNSSIIRYNGRLLLGFRTGWEGANCHIAVLDERYNVAKIETLHQLKHPRASIGREDPRLFVYNDRLHIAYIGVSEHGTAQLYARLKNDYRVEEVFLPQYTMQKSWEKNWSFFDYEKELFAVYQGNPHCIIHVKGNKAYPFTEQPNNLPWFGGHIRGGAPPVRVGDYYYHWFHGYIEPGTVTRRYAIGLNIFEAKLPFKVVRQTEYPLLWADDRTKPSDQYASCVFPCGAILENGVWKISMGVHDRWTEIIDVDADWVEKQL